MSQEASSQPAPEVAPIRSGEEFDERAVESYVRARVPDLEGPMEALQFPGGHANLTYLLRFPNRELVLRRPPLGPVAPGSHDMRREHKVLSRLWEFISTAPRSYLLCEDESLIGAVFFVMERRTGVVIRAGLPPELAHFEDVGRRVSFALVDAMADFHDVDFEKAGLADLGKPEGFVDRQLRGWHDRWHKAKNVELPLFDELHAELLRTQPPSPAPSLVHNDLKLDNCQFDADDPDRVKSIFDWDMTTLGDPLCDLGTLLGYWPEAGDELDRHPTNQLEGVELPSRQEIALRYAARRGTPLETIAWYEAFAIWKTAVVIQQIYIRWVRGQTTDARFEGMGQRVPQLVRTAAGVLEAASR